MQTIYTYYIGTQLCYTADPKQIPEQATSVQTASIASMAAPIRLDSTQTVKPDYLVNINKALASAKTQNKNIFTQQAGMSFTYVDGTSFNGGPATAQTFFLLVQAAQILGELTVVLYDTSNEPHTYTLTEAQTIASQINAAYQVVFSAYQKRKMALNAFSALINWDKGQTWDYPTEQLMLDPLGQVWQCANAGVTGGDPTIFAASPAADTRVRDNTITWIYLGDPYALIDAVNAPPVKAV